MLFYATSTPTKPAKRLRRWEARQQMRSALIHRENRERILREREAMAAKYARDGKITIKIDAGEAPVRKAEAKERKCIRCDRTFRSEGVGNRMCWTCRRRS